MSLLATNAARGQSPLLAVDAAHIDWAVKNCDVVSTPTERNSADAARAKDQAKFQTQYEDEYKKILAATESSASQSKMCQRIKEWYGPLGAKIADLISLKSESSTAAASDTRSTQDSSAGNKKGHRH
jgi:hypothetical protein